MIGAVLVAVAVAALLQTWLRARHPALDPVRDYSCLRTNRWGTKALREMCRALGYRTRVWRRALKSLPADAKVVLMIAPKDPLVDGEFEALRKWVEDGGTLVVAVLSETPEARVDGRLKLTAGYYLAAWLAAVPVREGLQEAQEIEVRENPWKAYRVKRLALVWPAAIEYLETRSGVKRRLAQEMVSSEALDKLPAVKVEQPAGRLMVGGRAVGLDFRVGRGRVVLLAEPDIFSNRFIGRADNALLAAAVIFPQAQDGEVLFDEYHHGPARFHRARGRESGRTLGGVILLFLGTLTVYLLLGGIRMGRAHVLKPRPRRSVREYVDAVAWLYQRAGMRAAAIEMLERALRRACALRLGVAVDAPAKQFAQAARQRGLPFAERLEAALKQCEAIRQNPNQLTRQRFVSLARELTELRGEIAHHGH